MKRKSRLFLLVNSVSLLLSLASCSKPAPASKINLTYGHIANEEITSVIQIGEIETAQALYDRIDTKENFIVAIYNNVTTCGCWDNFQPVLVEFANKYHININYIGSSKIRGNNYGIYTEYENMPSIAAFVNGQLVLQSIYGKNYDPMFNTFKYFEDFFLANFNLPKMYYLEKSVLETYMDEDKNFNLYVMRSGCGDCSMLSKTIIPEWNNLYTSSTVPLYIFDLEPYYSTSTYDTLKGTLGLKAGSSDFGYGDGYVPTFQNRKGHTVNDMITVLNDSMDMEEEVMHSYFTEDRLNMMKFLNEDEKSQYVFDNMTLTEEQMEAGYRYLYGTYYPTYHYPLVHKFLNYYLF